MIKIDPSKQRLQIKTNSKKIISEVEALIAAMARAAEKGMSDIQKREFWTQVQAELKGKKKAAAKRA